MSEETYRCGHVDPLPGVREFVTASLPRWRKSGLSYWIQSLPPGIDPSGGAKAVQQSFNSWLQHVANLTARVAVSGETPDIVISTGRGAQHDFDGPSGVLAWCYLPNGSDQQIMMRLDTDENWSLVNDGRGVYLLAVLTHELGHGLGLDHSNVSTALMAPMYSRRVWEPQQNDDVPRIQERYGKAAPKPVDPVGPGFEEEARRLKIENVNLRNRLTRIGAIVSEERS